MVGQRSRLPAAERSSAPCESAVKYHAGCLLDPRLRYPDKISHRGIFLKSIALKLPEDLLDESARLAGTLHLSRAEYIRVAIRRMNRKTAARLRAEKLAELSKMVRGESMRVNAEFAAIEREPNV